MIDSLLRFIEDAVSLAEKENSVFTTRVDGLQVRLNEFEERHRSDREWLEVILRYSRQHYPDVEADWSRILERLLPVENG